jgi:hypothetical protein
MVGAARQITVLAGLIATFIAPTASSAESMSATGRPEREYRSAQREGTPVSATGRPEREYRSAQREGTR